MIVSGFSPEASSVADSAAVVVSAALSVVSVADDEPLFPQATSPVSYTHLTLPTT